MVFCIMFGDGPRIRSSAPVQVRPVIGETEGLAMLQMLNSIRQHGSCTSVDGEKKLFTSKVEIENQAEDKLF